MKLKYVSVGAAAVSATLGGLAWSVAGRSSQVFAPSVYRGSGRRRSIALTFDDGPTEGSLRLLDYLEEQNVRATFFQCGMNVKRYPAIARAIAGRGHEIGNHTYSHPRLFGSTEFIYNECARAQKVIEAETGLAPTLFRAPYGLRWRGLDDAQMRLGLLGVMWTVIGHDWQAPPHLVTSHVLSRAAPGGIICLHDGRAVRPAPDISDTLEAARRIIPELRRQGYHFETVSELLQPD